VRWTATALARKKTSYFKVKKASFFSADAT
jgi:hypothetical protein